METLSSYGKKKKELIVNEHPKIAKKSISNYPEFQKKSDSYTHNMHLFVNIIL